MLQFLQTFLQTGKVLYVLAGVCGLGIISKLVTSSLYKRLIQETENMVLTKNKNLRNLKQRTENLFLMSRGLRNTNAYIEKQLYNFRFMNLSLDCWDNLSVQAMILCFLIGGLAAFGAYWYRCDSYYIVLYGTMGIISGLFLVFVDNSVNISLKRQQLADCLVDYMENSPHMNRPAEKFGDADAAERRAPNVKNTAESSKIRLREMGRKNLKVVEDTAVEEDGSTKHSLLNRKKDRKGSMSYHGTKTGEKERTDSKSTQQELSNSRKLAVQQMPDMMTQEEELRKSINGLKQSLDQIAASREQVQKDAEMVKTQEIQGLKNGKKEWNPEDIRILGELLQEYLG